MKKQFEKREVKLDEKKYLVPTYFFGDNNANHKLILSPGFSLPGKYFENFSNLLNSYMYYNGKIQIIVPEIIGRKIISTDGLSYKNNTHEKNAILYNHFLNQLNLDKEPVEFFQSYCAQSSGPINFKSNKVILINPLVEVNYNRFGFVLRAMNGSLIKEPIFTITSGFGIDYSLEFIGNLQNNIACLGDLTSLTNDEIYPINKNSDVLLIAGVNKKFKDQYFNYKGIEEKIGYKYNSFEFLPIIGGTHHSIVYEPLKFVKPIRKHILK